MTVYQRAAEVEENTAVASAAFANSILFLALVYAISFNYVRDDIRTSIAGIICLTIIVRCIASWTDPSAQIGTFSLIGLFAILISHYVFGNAYRSYGLAEYIALTIRTLSGIAFILYYCHIRDVISPKLLLVAIVIITVVAVWAALTKQPIMFADTPRPAVFTGGEDGLHASAYVVGGAMLGAITLWQRQRLSLWLALSLVGPLGTLVLLYQVRTVWLIVVIFLLVVAICRWGITVGILQWLFVASIGAISVALVGLAGTSIDFSELSSGRTAVYWERFALLTERSAIELVLGTGAGSEMLMSDVWWWEAKNSHNDFIDIAIQSGLLGLGLAAAVIFSSMRGLSVARLPVFGAVLGGSVVSNGLLGRPMIAILYFAIMLVPAERLGSRPV